MADVATSESRVSREQSLRSFATAVLTASGVAAADAEIVAEVLVSADLRGHAEHGVAQLPAYVRHLRAGTVAARPGVRLVRETPTAVLFDAGNGLGAPVAKRAMDAVIAKAAEHGAAFGAVRNSNPFGIAGYYAMQALAADQIGIASSNAARAVLPTFGLERMLGENPLAFAIPAGVEPAYVLDFSTAQRAAAGDPEPLGGPGTETSGHKGYGLGLLADILCGVLSGGAFGRDLPLAGPDEAPGAISHFFAALRVDGFLDPARLRADLDRELRSVKDSPKSPGYDRIYVAGELEHERTRIRRERGIPIHATTWNELNRIAGELGVPLLEHFSGGSIP